MSETKALRDKSASRLNPINHVYVLLRGERMQLFINGSSRFISPFLFPGNAEYFLHELPFHFEVRVNMKLKLWVGDGEGKIKQKDGIPNGESFTIRRDYKRVIGEIFVFQALKNAFVSAVFHL
ncbi:hypothetical protein CEXT_135891 [Caerostris extrusa]|uniref:Galectin n=1 Tax=Caerostris extrusa TaxID=172846 RepID=A0AAV4MBL4_CAEEX|nr:hypothetical protein CEXT_135891 [Caerostris extrusa]